MSAKMNDELTQFRFDFEAVDKCPLCDGVVMLPSGSIKWLDMDFWYVICPNCNLKFLNPRPTEESYKVFYRDYFWQQKIRNVGFIKLGQMWNTGRNPIYDDKEWEAGDGIKKFISMERDSRFESITNAISSHFILDETKDILEVGAGFGTSLEEINKKFGCSVYAIEPSKESIKVIKESGAIKILGIFAEEMEQICDSPNRFDAVVFSQCLENLVRPFEIIQYALKSLKNSGIIYVQCANLFTFDQMNPYHPFIFSEPALMFMAHKYNLRPQRHGETTHRMLTMTFEKNG